MTPQRFPFAIDHRYGWCLRLFGVRAGRAWVEVDRSRFSARFGWWSFETPAANLGCTQVTGPYKPVRAIGAHVSLADRGLSFGSNAERGVCVLFREPVPGGSFLGLVKHPGLTVTVEDPEALVAAIERVRPD